MFLVMNQVIPTAWGKRGMTMRMRMRMGTRMRMKRKRIAEK